MVEGKVRESFGPTLEEWLKDPSPGKTRRLSFLTRALGLDQVPPRYIGYKNVSRRPEVMHHGRA